ncbi:MAG TPA: Hsp20/alpha crystallin family protein [Fimbriimonas sp.]|nr:Hsp20/alpha crystallin family protein [Fimbriimonas sp.]
MPRRDVEEWFWTLGGELQKMNEELTRARPKVASGRAWEPRVDVFEEEHRIMVRAELAGVDGDQISLLYLPERHSILLRGVRDEEEICDGNRTGILQLEIFYGPFAREIKLPDAPVDASGIKAQYRNGFLIVMIPKMERVVVTQTVTIKKV